MVTPKTKSSIAAFLQQQYRFSQRRCCRLLAMGKLRQTYKQPVKDVELIDRLQQLAQRYPAYGCPMLHQMLKAEGLVINHKRTHRLYRLLNLQVRTKRRNKVKRPRRVKLLPSGINQSWSMDFVSDQLACGRRIRILNVMDDYSRECLGQLIQPSITGGQVGQFLNELLKQRGKPLSIVCDNGPEITGKAMFAWQQESGVKLQFIEPGKPTQNAFVESFNGKFRNSCLNLHWFKNLEEAKQLIADWRHHYNTERPHSSLNYLPPEVFASQVA